MLVKEDSPRLKKTLALLVKAGISVGDMRDLLTNLDWLAGMAEKLSQPDVKVVKKTELDKPSRELKGKKGKRRGSR